MPSTDNCEFLVYASNRFKLGLIRTIILFIKRLYPRSHSRISKKQQYLHQYQVHRYNPSNLACKKHGKSHFVTDINDYYAKKEEEISNFYKKSVSSYKGSYAETTSDIVRLLRKIVESGVSLSTRTKHISQGVLANGFTFKVNELLNPTTDEAKKLFAQFLAEFMYWEKLGAKTYTDMQMPDGSFSITYYVEVSSFSVIVNLINDFIRHYESREGQSEFAIDAFERNFESDLKTYCNDIKDEIKLFSH